MFAWMLHLKLHHRLLSRTAAIYSSHGPNTPAQKRAVKGGTSRSGTATLEGLVPFQKPEHWDLPVYSLSDLY